MIITFPFEDDPYYSTSQPRSYAQSSAAALTTPALAKKYFDLARGTAGGVFPVGTNRFWHGGVHLVGTGPVRAIADGTVVAYRLDSDYTASALDAELKQCRANDSGTMAPRVFSGSFVLIRHECEKNNGVISRYAGAHFYSLYANLLPARQLNTKALLPPFLTTGELILTVSALRGDEVDLIAVNSDGHRMAKVRVTDVNTGKAVEGWIERMYLDQDQDQGPPLPLVVGAKLRLSYPVSSLYANHPSERKWRTRDAVKTLEYAVRAGEVIGYPGQTDGQFGFLPDSFHFEIFTAENSLVKPMKPLVPVNIREPQFSFQEFDDGSKIDPMGKVWLTRSADLSRLDLSTASRVSASDLVLFPAGSCFVSAAPCATDGSSTRVPPSKLICFSLLDLQGNRYYAYANQSDAIAESRPFLKDAWVTLSSDSDWVTRGWQAYEDKELKGTDDAFVEDEDAIMLKIVSAANSSPATLSLADLRSQGVDAILRTVAVRFHSEWDSDGASKRYEKLTTGEHRPLPQLTEAQFSAFLRDADRQQFWKEAKVQTDGVSGLALTPLSDAMNAKNWHFHPIGFLAQMRECLITDAALSEEEFEKELRNNWVIGLKLIEKRLKQLQPWSNPDMPLPPAPPQPVAQVREYATLGTIWNRKHATLWENFVYWFGVDPNTITTPVVSTTYTTRSAAPAGHHVYVYMKGMRDAFRHVSTQHIMKGSLGFEAGAWVWQNRYPAKPLVPAENGFKMECINIACQHGLFFKKFQRTDPVDQNRMQLQLHEISHMVGTTCSDDQTITLPNGQADPNRYNGNTGYGAERARVLAEFQPERALANAENVSLFILSAKDEPN